MLVGIIYCLMQLQLAVYGTNDMKFIYCCTNRVMHEKVKIEVRYQHQLTVEEEWFLIVVLLV